MKNNKVRILCTSFLWGKYDKAGKYDKTEIH